MIILFNDISFSTFLKGLVSNYENKEDEEG